MPPVSLDGPRNSVLVNLAANGSVSAGVSTLSSVTPVQTGILLATAIIAVSAAVSVVGSAVGAAAVSGNLNGSVSVGGVVSRIVNTSASITVAGSISAIAVDPVQSSSAAITTGAAISGASAWILSSEATVGAAATVLGEGQDAGAAEVSSSAAITATVTVAGDSSHITASPAAITATVTVAGDSSHITASPAAITAGATVAGDSSHITASPAAITAGATVAGGGETGGDFAPSDIFSGGDVGFSFDPDTSTCFTDTARTTAAAVDDNVASIADNSGNGVHATANSASKEPILKQTDGHYYLRFDGVSDYMETGGVASGKDFTIFVGLVQTGNSTANCLYLHYTSGSNRVGFYANDKAAGDGGARLFMNNSGNIINENASNLSGTKCVYTVGSKSGSHFVRRNGVSVATSSSSEEADFLPATIGASIGGSQLSEVDIYSITAINRTATSGEIDDMEQYIADKMGVTL